MIGKLRLQLIDAIRGTKMMAALKELKKHQYLSKPELEAIQQERLKTLFEKAKKYTSYYSGYKSFDEVPVITKDIIRANTPGLISAAFKGKLHEKQSGGSTGVPLIYYTTIKSQSYLWAGIIISWESAGYKFGDKVAFIAGSSLIKTSLAHKIFYKLFNIDVYPATPLNEETLSSHAESVRKNKSKIIYGYANVINELADYIKTKKVNYLSHIKGIVCTAEILKENVRKNIEAAFGVKVINQYGCSEAGASAFECDKGNLHLISSKIIYHIDNEQNLVCTDLMNEGFIMLKYFTDDIIKFSGKECPCKRTFPVIQEVIGRTNDIIVDKYNNRLHDSFFYFLFKYEHTVRKFQACFDDTSITVNIHAEGSQPEGYYAQYLEQIKDQVKFDTYKLIFNHPFVLTQNGKHKQIIDNRK